MNAREGGRPETRENDLSKEASELRCECRRLLAKVSDGYLELSCPRCKRKVILDLNKLARDGFKENAILYL